MTIKLGSNPNRGKGARVERIDVAALGDGFVIEATIDGGKVAVLELMVADLMVLRAQITTALGDGREVHARPVNGHAFETRCKLAISDDPAEVTCAACRVSQSESVTQPPAPRLSCVKCGSRLGWNLPYYMTADGRICGGCKSIPCCDVARSTDGRLHMEGCPKEPAPAAPFPRPPADDAERQSVAALVGERCCGDISRDDYASGAFQCHRPKFHEGPHISGAGGNVTATWPAASPHTRLATAASRARGALYELDHACAEDGDLAPALFPVRDALRRQAAILDELRALFAPDAAPFPERS